MEAANGKILVSDQYAIVAHGKAEKEWPFLACSDSRFTEVCSRNLASSCLGPY